MVTDPDLVQQALDADPDPVFSARNYRPSFRENKPKTLVLYD
jgi:hypothetical protein